MELYLHSRLRLHGLFNNRDILLYSFYDLLYMEREVEKITQRLKP